MERLPASHWDLQSSCYSRILLMPFAFQDLRVTVLDVVPAHHERGWSVAPHSHGYFEFNYVSHGAMHTALAASGSESSSEFVAPAGSMFLIPPNVCHAHRPTGLEDDGFCIRFCLEQAALPGGNSECLAEELINALSAPVPRAFSEMGSPALLDTAERCETVAQLQANTLRWLLDLHALYARAASQHTVSQRPPASQGGDLVQMTMMYLNAFYHEQLSVQQLAGLMFVSYRHLARVFKQQKGCTIVEMLQSIRVLNAKLLLSDPTRSIRSVAEETGFLSEYYFSKTFRAHTQMSPSQYRKQLQSHSESEVSQDDQQRTRPGGAHLPAR